MLLQTEPALVRSGSTMFAYGNIDKAHHIQVDPTSIFVPCTNMKVCLYDYS